MSERKKKINKIHLRIGFLIHDVSRLRRTIYDQRLKPYKLTRSQFWVLINLARYGEAGCVQMELARIIDVGKVAMSGLIQRLMLKDLIFRNADSSDGRSKRVYISAAGNELVDELQEIAHELNVEVLKGISRDEQKVLADLLGRMKKNLVDMEAVPGSPQPPRSR